MGFFFNEGDPMLKVQTFVKFGLRSTPRCTSGRGESSGASVALQPRV
jgi:hypothetical protein